MTDKTVREMDRIDWERLFQQKEKELYSIQRIGKALSSTLRIEELLRLIIQEITSLMDADRSSLFIVDHEKGEIWSQFAQKAEIREIRLPIGRGISGYVAQTGEVINIPDAYQDERFDPATDKKTGYHTRSILCMPVWEPHGKPGERRVTGVIQVLNKRDGAFSGEDEDLLEALAAQVAISISNARLYRRLEKKYREMDLLYDFEQMLNVENDLGELTHKILERTVGHLQAEWVFAFLPGEGKYSFFAVAGSLQGFRQSATTVPLGWIHLMENLSREGLLKNWGDACAFFGLGETEPPSGELQLISAPVPFSEEQTGTIWALVDGVGRSAQWEDDRMLMDLVGQKIYRAREIETLRGDLLKQERLSAIGQLMSTIVHDIRGPVNTIYGFVDLMKDADASQGEREEYAEIIRSEFQSAMNLITEVLDFAKGKTSILARKSSVANLLKRFRPRLEQMGQKYNTEVEVEVQSQQLLYIDVEKLNRVFYNITKNAHEAMGEGGRFLFRIYDDSEAVVFQFTDNGPGIPREIQDRLFDSFVTSGKEGGTGLGLAIVQKIVAEHHGSIAIDSQPGQGATFRISLPIYRPPSA
ncbi:MAG TPA: GAF domain-containing sensor histidine kinase [Calditrichia bacterium]|nr:GAF domain-containing sensor histidine kinase [Calditrichota bacterium]HQU70752.1 GAF domain-containing sensor histidine kinase [Calditrichia bacterium]HQV31195.1 GAF domain-containing sensor histidine kinase [Calditrichia bacterium]